MSQEENAGEKWENWRTKVDQTLGETASSLGSLSSQISDIKKAIESQHHEDKGSEDLPDLKAFLSDHVPACPECQKVLDEAGYIKKPEPQPEPASTPERKSFRTGALFGRK